MNPLLQTAVTLFLVDLVWIATGGIFARELVRDIQCGEDLEMKYLPGIIAYVLLAYMLLETKSYKQAFLYGVCIYGVYDFTTLALLKRYDWRFAIADTLWGGILFVITRYLLRNL